MKTSWLTVRTPDPECSHIHLRLCGKPLGRKLFFCTDCRCYVNGRGRNPQLTAYMSKLGGMERTAQALDVEVSTIRNWRDGKFPIPKWMQLELDTQRALMGVMNGRG